MVYQVEIRKFSSGNMRKRKQGAQLESEPVSDFIRKNEIKIDVSFRFDLSFASHDIGMCLSHNFLSHVIYWWLISHPF